MGPHPLIEGGGREGREWERGGRGYEGGKEGGKGVRGRRKGEREKGVVPSCYQKYGTM